MLTADPPERDVLRQLLPGMNVVSIPDQRKLPDDGAVWLWDSQPLQGDPVPVGQRVDPERLASIPVGDPLRLLRIDHKLWTSCLETMLSSLETIDISAPLLMMIDTPISCLAPRVNSI